MSNDTAPQTQFLNVDWESTDSGRSMTVQTVAFGLLTASLAALFCYDYFAVAGGEPTLAGWNVTRFDWLFLYALTVFTVYVCYPLARNRELTAFYWRELRETPLALASLVYLVGFALVGTFGPPLLARPELSLGRGYMPPAWMAIPVSSIVGDCVGPVVDGTCHGTWKHPFGTYRGGRDVFALGVYGSGVAFRVVMIVAMLVMPLATAVGTVAGYLGGRVDYVLSGLVNVLDVVPALLVFIFFYMLEGGGTPFLLVLVYGLLNWGGIASVVRSRTIQEATASYVRAAQNAGATDAAVIKRHLVPNTVPTVITALVLQAPKLVIVEATLSYLGLMQMPLGYVSWGDLIATGMSGRHFPTYWWLAVFPLLALTVTVVAFNVLGNALEDITDPRSS